MNVTLLKAKIQESKRRVIAAEGALESGLQKLTEANGGETTVMSTLLENAFQTLRDARGHLADLTDLLASDEQRPAERNCPACNRLIRVNARMCGYCWHKLV